MSIYVSSWPVEGGVHGGELVEATPSPLIQDLSLVHMLSECPQHLAHVQNLQKSDCNSCGAREPSYLDLPRAAALDGPRGVGTRGARIKLRHI